MVSGNEVHHIVFLSGFDLLLDRFTQVGNFRIHFVGWQIGLCAAGDIRVHFFRRKIRGFRSENEKETSEEEFNGFPVDFHMGSYEVKVNIWVDIKRSAIYKS
jgi:hypothetical protein